MESPTPGERPPVIHLLRPGSPDTFICGETWDGKITKAVAHCAACNQPLPLGD